MGDLRPEVRYERYRSLKLIALVFLGAVFLGMAPAYAVLRGLHDLDLQHRIEQRQMEAAQWMRFCSYVDVFLQKSCVDAVIERGMLYP